MESKWFVDENVKNIDKEILLCFPYAGASINMFSMWKEYIDKVIVCPVKLPFRDARRKEKLPESVQKLAEVFVKENIDIMRKRYSIFGHCTGAILGYEIARQTYEKTGNEPTVIIASSSQEPAIIPKEAILLAGASDSEIQAYLETERLVDKSILEMPEFQEYYFPILRADFRLFASYHASYHKFNCPIITIYETRVSCQGQPISEYDEIKIIDSDGKEVAQGEIGELIVKGPYTIQEYYRLLDNDKYFNEEGFYLSGDKVRKLEDGNLKVVGRVKEQINRAGEKIMPSELEELIIKHPDIMDCAVIGIEDEMLGNKICVYAVARKNISLLDIRKHLEEAGIAMFKLPDVLRLVKRIPVTAMKKVDKEALRILEKEHYE